MVTFAAATLLLAALKGADQWGAVWFVVVGLGIWGVGLGVVARGLRRRQRWALTPLVLTQLIFGLSALNVFASATTPAKVVWGGVVIVAVVMLRLTFGREVRQALVTPLG